MTHEQQQNQPPHFDAARPSTGENGSPLRIPGLGRENSDGPASDSSTKLSPWALGRVKIKLKDRLHEAQESLLKKDEEKQSTYAVAKVPPNRNSWKKPSDVTSSIHGHIMPEIQPVHTLKESDDQLQMGEQPATRKNSIPGRKRASIRRIHSNPDSLGRSRTFTNFDLNSGLALLGLDWYHLERKQKKLSWLFLIQNLYYWCYLTYIVSLITFGGLLMWFFEPDSRLTFTQAFYSAAACVTQSGLSVVDWSKQSTSTYIVSFCLILGGSAPLLHLAPVLLRRSSFRKQKRLAEEWCATRRMSAGISVAIPEAHAQQAEAPSPSRPSRRHTFSGGVWDDDDIFFRGYSEPAGSDEYSDADRFVAKVGSLPPASSDMPSVSVPDLTDMHDLEYQALGMVVKIMLGYWFCAHALSISIFFCYFHFGTGDIQAKLHAEGLSSHWNAIYLAVSSFQNNGLVMTPSSVMDFAKSPTLLNTIATLIILGNTGLPIMVRLIASALRQRAVPQSENERVLDFLLEHPRRCFTHMFPAVHTLWLLLVVLTLNLTTTAVLLWQDAGSDALNEFGLSDSFFNALFQAVSARTCGLNSINIAQLSQGSTFFICVMMYLATTPTVVTMRFSQISAGNAGELDITGRAEGIEEDVIKGDNSLKTQARRYLTQDITYLVVIMFVILVLEKDNFEASARHASPFTDGIYGDFNFFKVFFEMTSAYGTVGYSLGFQNQSASFSGKWCPVSQYLLVGVMIMGRLRGLPDSIDPSVRVAMQHSEGKHHAFVSRT